MTKSRQPRISSYLNAYRSLPGGHVFSPCYFSYIETPESGSLSLMEQSKALLLFQKSIYIKNVC